MMRVLILIWLFCAPLASFAQEGAEKPLTIMTITRPPFSFLENGTDTGFSVDLWRKIAAELDVAYEFQRTDSFGDMLNAVETGQADGAIANITITSARESVMDFTQPIFESGLQVMVPDQGNTLSIWPILMRGDLWLAVFGAFGLLLGGGMVMWALERRHQDYFNQPARKALFPAFWWALNLIVNGGFEQLAPRSFLGRIFGTFLVISSLFLVSIFVAKITATLTVDAIQNNVSGIADLYDKRVATIGGSTSADFLDRRDMRYRAYDGLEDMLADFEAGHIDAVVFDAPVLAYYAATRGQGTARMIGTVFLPENYGMALPAGSDLAEPVNRALLKLRENGQYDALLRKWFGG